jgi:hypothetical protein
MQLSAGAGGYKLPSNNYTPFDYITAHSQVEFHNEKQEKEDNDDQGDDKTKILFRFQNNLLLSNAQYGSTV